MTECKKGEKRALRGGGLLARLGEAEAGEGITIRLSERHLVEGNLEGRKGKPWMGSYAESKKNRFPRLLRDLLRGRAGTSFLRRREEEGTTS